MPWYCPVGSLDCDPGQLVSEFTQALIDQAGWAGLGSSEEYFGAGFPAGPGFAWDFRNGNILYTLFPVPSDYDDPVELAGGPGVGRYESAALFSNEFNQDNLTWAQATLVNNVPVPGPLPLFGVAAAFGFSRKLRKRIKANTNPVSSTFSL